MPDAPITGPTESLVDQLRGATQRLVRAVDAMTDDEWAAPSLLAGWSRAHVVAHVTLNSEGLSQALDVVAEGGSPAMYPSQEARDSGIETLAGASSSVLRDRHLASTSTFSDALARVPEDRWGSTIERVPGGRVFAAGDVPSMRLRELEIHHADLGLAYSPADWSDAFAVHLLDAMAARDAWPGGFTAYAEDLGRSWTCGEAEGGPTVSGPAAALGWWLSGRGTGERLTSDNGVLPGIEAW